MYRFRSAIVGTALAPLVFAGPAFPCLPGPVLLAAFDGFAEPGPMGPSELGFPDTLPEGAFVGEPTSSDFGASVRLEALDAKLSGGSECRIVEADLSVASAASESASADSVKANYEPYLSRIRWSSCLLIANARWAYEH